MKNEKQGKNKGLGKGLSSLLGDSAAVASLQETHDPASITGAESGTIDVAITAITPGPWQPRRRFDDAALDDLATSIRQHGVVQPLLVRSSPDKKGKYELIAGERRWRAAQKAGLHQLPVLVRKADDQMAAEIALIENIQRDDLSVIEEAAGYRRLMDEFGYIQEDLAKIIGKSRSHLANTMRLLNLPGAVQDMLAEGVVTAGQVRPLIGRDDAEKLSQTIASKGLSARQAEDLVSRCDKPRPSQPPVDANIIDLEKKLTAKHGLDIAIRFNSKKGDGRITIMCKSLDQFDTVIALLEGK
jgi:ParB family chromosome partitioning protein